MQNRRLSAGENSAIVNGVSKERARAKQPWPKALARHPLSAPSLVTRRDEPVRGTERCPCVGPRGRKKRQEKEERERERERERQADGGQTGRPRLLPPRSFPSASLRSSRGVLVFSFFCCFPLHTGLAMPGTVPSQNHLCEAGKAPGSRSVASRPLPSSLLFNETLFSSLLFLLVPPLSLFLSLLLCKVFFSFKV